MFAESRLVFATVSAKASKYICRWRDSGGSDGGCGGSCDRLGSDEWVIIVIVNKMRVVVEMDVVVVVVVVVINMIDNVVMNG